MHRNCSCKTFLSTFLFLLFVRVCCSYVAPHFTIRQCVEHPIHHQTPYLQQNTLLTAEHPTHDGTIYSPWNTLLAVEHTIYCGTPFMSSMGFVSVSVLELAEGGPTTIWAIMPIFFLNSGDGTYPHKKRQLTFLIIVWSSKLSC